MTSATVACFGPELSRAVPDSWTRLLSLALSLVAKSTGNTKSPIGPPDETDLTVGPASNSTSLRVAGFPDRLRYLGRALGANNPKPRRRVRGYSSNDTTGIRMNEIDRSVPVYSGGSSEQIDVLMTSESTQPYPVQNGLADSGRAHGEATFPRSTHRTLPLVTTIPLRLPDRIRRARKLRNVDRGTLARNVGVTRSAVTQWEHPRGSTPSVEHLVRIAQSTGTSFEWLATGTGAVHASGEREAVAQGSYAQDDAEEALLSLWRDAKPATRSAILVLLNEAVGISRRSQSRARRQVDAVAPE